MTEAELKIRYALKYAALGWRIMWASYPIGIGAKVKCSCPSGNDPSHNLGSGGKSSAGKHPYLQNWQKIGTTDPKWIQDAFTLRPYSNISILTGLESLIFVLDVDGEDGAASLTALEKKYGKLPDTVTFITGSGGLHMVYKHPVYVIQNSTSEIGAGLDIRGKGGQIIAPPSKHYSEDDLNPGHNAVYSFDPNFAPLGFEDEPGVNRCVPISEASDWLLSLISAKSLNSGEGEHRKRLDWAEAIKGAPQGRRDHMIWTTACSIREYDKPIEYALDFVREQAQNCRPPFDIKVAEEKVHRAYSNYTPNHRFDKNAIRRTDPPRQESPTFVKPWPLTLEEHAPLPTKVLLKNQGREVPVFPPWLGNYITAVSQSIEVPASMPATIALATVAACLMKKGRVRVKPDWFVPLNLFTVVVSDPSTRKSPIFKEVTKPIHDYELRQIESTRGDVAYNQHVMNGLKQKLKKMEREAAKDGAPTNSKEEVCKVHDEMRELKIKPPQYVMQDCTPEVVFNRLQENDERMAILGAEGAAIFKAMGDRYNRNPDFSIFIEGWSGDTAKCDRMTREGGRLDEPLLTLNVTIQNEIMPGVASSPAAKQGLLARFLYCYPPDMSGKRTHEDLPIDPAIRLAYYEHITKLLNLELPSQVDKFTDEPNVLYFEDDAREAFKKYEIDVDDQLGKTFDNDMKDWLGKLCGTVARIIGILHIAENIDNCEPDRPQDVWKFPIRGHTVEAGILLGNFYAAHARTAFREMQADTSKNDVIHFVNWLKDTQRELFFRQDAIHFLGGAQNKHIAILTSLSHRGYIMTTDPKARIEGHDNICFRVNPDVLANSFLSPDEINRPT